MTDWASKGFLLLLGGWIGLDILAKGFAEFTWFANLGYLNIFKTQIIARIGLWFLALSITAIYLGGNLVFAQRWRLPRSVTVPSQTTGGLKLSQLLWVVGGLSLVMAGILTHLGQLMSQFWQSPSEIVMSAAQSLPQFTWESMTTIVKNWLQKPWQLLLLCGFCLGVSLYPGPVLAAIALALSLGMGLVISSQWPAVLAWLNAMPFDRQDPVFAKDIGFYIFTLPIWELLRSGLTAISLTALVSVALIYLLADNSLSQGYFGGFSRRQLNHLFALLGVVLLALGWGLWLDRYALLYSARKIFYGAGYTDVTVTLPIKMLLSLGAAALGCLFLFRASLGQQPQRPLRLLGLLAVYFTLSF